MNDRDACPNLWINGAIVPAAEARISPFDHGFTCGDGVFETMRVYGGVPFAIRRHLERLGRSADRLDLVPPGAQLLAQGLHDVVAANDLSDGRLRITVTGGASPIGSERGAATFSMIAAARSIPEEPQPADVVIVPWPRNGRGALTGAKTLSYGENVVALGYARQRGATEAVFGNLAGNLCEAAGANIFIGIGGHLITPPLSSGCLAGVTRELLLAQGDIAEQDVGLAALREADEAFLTASTREIQPIRTVDGRPLSEYPGPLTAAATDTFRCLRSSLLSQGLEP